VIKYFFNNIQKDTSMRNCIY